MESIQYDKPARVSSSSSRYTSSEVVDESSRHSCSSLVKGHHKSSGHDANLMGFSFYNLSAYGFGSRQEYQKTFVNYPFVYLRRFLDILSREPSTRIDILKGLEGVVEGGEILVVLGRPGSGCSTFLKTLAGHTYGLKMDERSRLNYEGLTSDELANEFRGRGVYQAELDCHFPHLTVRQTLQFAAATRHPQNTARRECQQPSTAIAEKTAALLGLDKCLDTQVGNDFVPGISGGERKRTSIAEVLAGDAWLQCWDNSTRGLDSATALNFITRIKESTQQRQTVAAVSLYQASQDIYDKTDKVLLLYEGRQIYFGPSHKAKAYFISLGFVCPERSNDSDFLTSVTHPQRRQICEGYEMHVPRTPDEFSKTWQQSLERHRLLGDILRYENDHSFASQDLNRHRAIHAAQKARRQLRRRSPYIIPLVRQTQLCLIRAFQRMRQDIGAVISNVVGNLVISIVLGSMFYNMQSYTDSFLGRSVLIFFGVVLNSNLGAWEGTLLWDQRPIVEKHFRYGFYRPLAEAVSSVISDMPNKVVLTIAVNTPYYFLANLRRTPSAYFTYLLFSLASILTGSMLWRADGAASSTLAGSMPLGSVYAVLLMLYIGFAVPTPYMHPWLRWWAYINPGAYAFESLMSNEFSGRQFHCSNFVPEGPGYSTDGDRFGQCATLGALPGSSLVDGDAYLAQTYGFQSQHTWRNLGIIFGLGAFFGLLYLLASEYISLAKSKGEVLVYGNRHMKPGMRVAFDEETLADQSSFVARIKESIEMSTFDTDSCRSHQGTSTATFLWQGLSYEVPMKKGTKKILDNIDGWIRPGTLTALMGQTGAGKTTLLNVLAARACVGTISGFIGIDRHYNDQGFSSKIGYAQQQDLHLSTATVREALNFSAMLRQPATCSKREKLEYVDTVVDLLDMEAFVDAVIGVPGEGLNVEQRKRLTIGVELAARPELLIFLDEPTSGLDSDTAWSIVTLLRRLADHGQAILCTIHQPSDLVLEMFDHLLVLAEGQQVYFGDIGTSSATLRKYFENFGAPACAPDQNPAEWLLQLLDSKTTDWAAVWKASPERAEVLGAITAMRPALLELAAGETGAGSTASLVQQIISVTARSLKHDWRTPSFLWAKTLCTFFSAFLNGVTFWQSPNTIQGLQNQFFSLFVLFTVFSTQVQLILTRFIEMRTLYEARERLSRTYAWPVFMLSNVLAELPAQTSMAVLTFVPWYYPLGWFWNALALGALHERAGLTFLFVWTFMLWTQTYAQLFGAVAADAPTGVALANVPYILALLFSGLLVAPAALPRFWVFMYRVSPLSYYVSGTFGASLAGVDVTCAANELSVFDPPNGLTCGAYLADYLQTSGANLLNPTDSVACRVCPLTETSSFLASYGIYEANRWRDWGIALCYVVMNVSLAMGLYYLARVPKQAKVRRNAA